MTKTKLGRILSIATAISAVVLGILLIISCVHIYYSGGANPFTREKVVEYFALLALPSIITIGLAVAGIIFNTATDSKDEIVSARTSLEMLESYKKRFNISTASGDEAEIINKEVKLRKNLAIVCFIISAILFTPALIYLCFIADFSVENLNSDVIAALTVVLPLSTLSVCAHIPHLYSAEKSAERELEAIKVAIKKRSIEKYESTRSFDLGKKILPVVRYVVLGVAVLFVVLGIFNGGMSDVLAKAVKICTECIGLG